MKHVPTISICGWIMDLIYQNCIEIWKMIMLKDLYLCKQGPIIVFLRLSSFFCQYGYELISWFFEVVTMQEIVLEE